MIATLACAVDFSHGTNVVEQVQPVPDGEDVEERPQHGVEDHGDDVGEKLAVVEGVGRIWGEFQLLESFFYRVNHLVLS